MFSLMLVVDAAAVVVKIELLVRNSVFGGVVRDNDAVVVVEPGLRLASDIDALDVVSIRLVGIGTVLDETLAVDVTIVVVSAWRELLSFVILLWIPSF
jgi:hypothetical protein